ncbi:MAG: Uma2 family endonuclease [Oscillospiraceae bacterium]|jgi:Uma2 family endonuclease|nr:Uma2 family endonuclease [Oscillospiraceae bacterium]
MHTAVKKRKKLYTVEEFLAIDVRHIELINGEIVPLHGYMDMSLFDADGSGNVLFGTIVSSASGEHQHILVNLLVQLDKNLKGSGIEFIQNVTVRLNKTEVRKNKLHVFEPDIVVISDKSIIDEDGQPSIDGIPSIIVEIVDADNASHDTVYKLNHYYHAGVPEYWIVLPEDKAVLQYVVNKDEQYDLNILTGDQSIVFLNDKSIRLAEIFADAD